MISSQGNCRMTVVGGTDVTTYAAMMWVDREGFFCELECITPRVEEQACCHYPYNLVLCYGLPQLKVLSDDGICVVQDQGDSYTIWLSRDKTIDDEIVFESIHFLFADGELVGIKADQISIRALRLNTYPGKHCYWVNELMMRPPIEVLSAAPVWSRREARSYYV